MINNCFLNKILSVRNNPTGRTLTIAGVKFNFKKENLILQNQIKIYKDKCENYELIISLYEKYLMNEHINIIKNSKKFSKNGVLICSYNNNQDDEKFYASPSVAGNIGDYIQSEAQKQYFRKTDYLADRDTLSLYNGENINLIMNAWWYFWYKNKTFSDKINPLFISFHINNVEEIPEETLKYLKNHEPIGCRDYFTRNFLLKNNIKAYFSGCLSLTLGDKYKTNTGKKGNIIYFVDYNQGKNKKIDSAINKILVNYKNCRIENIKHGIETGKPVQEYLHKAENLLHKYANAKLIITSRIHCALPALGMETPVILVSEKFDRKRFDGLYQFLNTVGKDSFNNFVFNVNIDEQGFVYNSNTYKKYAEFLKNICIEFTK